MRRLWTVLAVGLVMMILIASPGEAVAQRQVSVPALSGAAGANIVIPININDPSGVAGADIRLTFEPGVLTLRTPSAQLTSLTAGFSLVTNPSAGQIIISMARANGIPPGTPGGPLVEVLATVNAAPNPCSCPLTLQSVSLFDEMANTIPSTKQNGSFTVTGPPCIPSRELTIGDVSGYPGDCNIIIPINIDNAAGIAGADIRVCYDPAIITITGARATPLTSGFSLVSNIMPPCVNISMASANPIPSGSGAFIELIACIRASAPPGTYPLDLQSCAVFDETGSPVSSSCNDGSVTVNPAQVYSISGTVTLNNGDVTQVTFTLSGTASRTTHPAANGAYSFDNLAPGNYTVTPSLTNRCFDPPIRTYLALNFDQTGQHFVERQCLPQVSVPALSGVAGADIVIPINIDDPSGVAGADITLTFDPGTLTLRPEYAQLTPLTTGFSLIANPSTGQIIISMARANGIPPGTAGGALVEVLATVNAVPNPCTTPLTLQSVLLFDEMANTIPSSKQNGSFTVIPSCGDGRIIDIPELEALPGTTIDVPVTINNAEGIVAVSDLTISWCSEPAMLQLQSVSTSSCTSGFNLTDNQEGHQVRVTLYGTNPLPAGPCDLIILRFLVSQDAAPGQCCAINILSGLVETQEGPLQVTYLPGEICIPLEYDVSGLVNYFTTGQTCAADPSKLVAGAQLAVAGPESPTVTADCSGHYLAADLISGNYTFTPRKSDQTNGITGLDASFIAQYTVGMRPLNECQRAAADVNGSGSITGLDASMIAQYTVGLRTLPFPCGARWKFTPANRSYTPLIADHFNENYVAMVVGDVNGSWQPPACPGGSPGAPPERPASVVQAVAQTVVVSLPDDCPAGLNGEDVAVPVHVTGATGVIAVTNLTILYDATKIYAVSAAKTAYTSDFSITPNLSIPGEAHVTLYSTVALSADEGDLLNITFHVIGQPGDCSALDLTAGLFETESEALPVEFDDGRFCVGPETVTITSGPSGAPNPVASGGTVNCSVTATDSCEHALTYLWSAPDGSFNDPTAQNPVWTAPANATCAATLLAISVTVGCYENPTVFDFDSFNQSVSGAGVDTVTITSGPSGNPNPVASGGTVNCSVTGEDSCGHALTYLWSAPDGSFNDPTARNPVWTAPANPTCAATMRAISVTARCYENQSIFDSGSFEQSVSGAVTDIVTITSGPSGNPNPVASGGDVNLSLTANDACGHDLTYLWTATGGTFDDPTSAAPVWHAPTNDTCATADYTIGVTVTCSGSQIATGSFEQGVSGTIVDVVAITSGPSGNPNPVASAGDVNLTLAADDTCGHALTYLWSATGGTFSDPTVQNPMWHAPANPDCVTTASYTISVTVTCSEGISAGDSYQQDVLPGAVDTVTITSGPSGTPNPVESAGDVNLSATANDACGHALSYLWSCPDGTFDNPNVQNPVWTAPANLTDVTQHYDITVTVTCTEGESDTATYSQGVEPEIRELHVDAGNTCPGTGTVDDPFCSIQPAIDDSEDGCTIIVRDGVYTGVGNRDIDFGGRAITLRSANGPADTTIDCQGNGRGLYFHSGEASDSVVDGLTITNGSVAGYGGAIFCLAASPTITNCIISNNLAEAGGGILTEGGAPSITNCVVTGNSATYGGGIYSSVTPAPSISKCTISENSAYAGGGIMVYSGSPDVANCAIIGNSATYGAGLYYSFAPSSTTLTSCTITENTASGGGGISCFASTLNIENCILWGNTAGWGSSYGPEMTVGATGYDSSVSISYSDVKGGTSYIYVDPGCTLDWDDASNVNVDPLFVQPGYWNGPTWTEGDYHLNPASPCVDAGSISGAPADDIDGDLRPVGALPDIGSDEYMDDYQDVPLLLVPDAISITRGGALRYDVTVINETPSPITFWYWTTVTRPDGNIHPPNGALLGPYEVTLNGSESRSARLTHRIPGTAPLGTYTYNAYIYGVDPIIANEYHFNFDIEAP